MFRENENPIIDITAKRADWPDRGPLSGVQFFWDQIKSSKKSGGGGTSAAADQESLEQCTVADVWADFTGRLYTPIVHRKTGNIHPVSKGIMERVSYRRRGRSRP